MWLYHQRHFTERPFLSRIHGPLARVSLFQKKKTLGTSPESCYHRLKALVVEQYNDTSKASYFAFKRPRTFRSLRSPREIVLASLSLKGLVSVHARRLR